MALSLANGRHPLALQADAQCKIGQLHPADMSAMTSRAPDWPLFSAAELVARERLPAALPHVTRRISDFLDSLSRAGVFAASCRRGDSERELSYLFQRDPSPLTQTMVRHATAGGHAHVLKWLKEHDDGLNGSLWKDYNFSPMDEAAKTGQLCVLQWLHENVEDCYAGRAMSWAASSGHLDAVKWLHSNRQDLCVNYAMDFAAANGHLHVVQYLHDNRREGCTTWAMDGAATHGHLQVVQWLYQNRSEGCTKAAVDGAAANGHLAVVQYLLQTVRLPDEKHWLGWAFTTAAENGRVAVVDWVHSTFRDNFSDSMLTFALSDASDNGHDEMVQWLNSQLKERR